MSWRTELTRSSFHQPIHAIIILLNDLLRPAQYYDVGVVHVVIDVIFSLSAPHGGLVGGQEQHPMQRPLIEGGTEVWAYLRRLRAKVWQSRNWTIELNWNRAEAIMHLRSALLPLLDSLNPSKVTTEPDTTAGTAQTSEHCASEDLSMHFPEDVSYPSGFNWADLGMDEMLGGETFFPET